MRRDVVRVDNATLRLDNLKRAKPILAVFCFVHNDTTRPGCTNGPSLTGRGQKQKMWAPVT